MAFLTLLPPGIGAWVVGVAPGGTWGVLAAFRARNGAGVGADTAGAALGVPVGSLLVGVVVDVLGTDAGQLDACAAPAALEDAFVGGVSMFVFVCVVGMLYQYSIQPTCTRQE